MGTHPFSQTSQVLDKNRERFMKGVDKIVKKAAQDGGRTMVTATRVDTGLARSNYQASISTKRGGLIPPYSAGRMLGIGEQANLLGATQQHAGVINRWKPTGEQPFFITNNVPYIGSLDSGGAHIAPGNMLRLGLQAAVVSIKTTRRILV